MLKTVAGNPIQLLIANRSEILAYGLVNSLTNQKDVDIVGVTHSITELLTLLKATKVEILLLDLGNERELLNLVQTLSIQYPHLCVLLFCSVLKPYIAYQLLGFNIAGILSWNIPLSEICESIRTAARGHIVLQHEIAPHVLFAEMFFDWINWVRDHSPLSIDYLGHQSSNDESVKVSALFLHNVAQQS
ncbi:hypothetical protein MNBD_CHLOROFLEXI01-2525 [hydrothermal vent metagenome]|uniref:Response regulatory domain-containing protein n=1 Tax=hydrothermal vent metagenome TaxID=652676 RepID=A0A3B0V426_9ZZZZ